MHIFADLVRRAVLELRNPHGVEDVLDIGSGPGYPACEITQRVGLRGAVHGVDPSASMLASAAVSRPRGSCCQTEDQRDLDETGVSDGSDSGA